MVVGRVSFFSGIVIYMERKYQKYLERYLDLLYQPQGGAEADFAQSETLRILSEKGFVSYRGIKNILSRHPSLIARILNLYRDNILNYTPDHHVGGNVALFTINDFKIMFYHAHKLLGYVDTPNTKIVTIGESPYKLGWAMECLSHRSHNPLRLEYIIMAISSVKCTDFVVNARRQDLLVLLTKDPDISKIRFNDSAMDGLGRYTEVDFIHLNSLFPGRQPKLKNNFWNFHQYFPNDRDIQARFSTHNLPNLHAYFTELGIDPVTILRSPGKIVFYDRSETARSIVCFCFLLRAICLVSTLSQAEMTKVIRKIRIVGMDGTYDSPDYLNYKIFLVRYTINRLFPELDKTTTDQIYQFYPMPLNHDIGFDEIETSLTHLPNLNRCSTDLYSSVCCTHKLLNTMSLPEQINTNARCVRSVAMGDININHLTQETDSGKRREQLAKYVQNPELRLDPYRSKLKPGELYTYCNVYRFITVLMLAELETWITGQLLPDIDRINYQEICLNRHLPEVLAEIGDRPVQSGECLPQLLDHYLDPASDNESIFRISPDQFQIVQSPAGGASVETGQTLLLLDLDETLGCFYIQYQIFSTQLVAHPILQELLSDKPLQGKLLKDTVLRVLARQVLRPGITRLISTINQMKQQGLIDDVKIYTANSDMGKYPGYIDDLTRYISEIAGVSGLITETLTGVSRQGNKQLGEFTALGYTRVYLVDDHPERVNPRSASIPITPYLAYINTTSGLDQILETQIKELSEYGLAEIYQQIFPDLQRLLHQHYLQDRNSPKDVYQITPDKPYYQHYVETLTRLFQTVTEGDEVVARSVSARESMRELSTIQDQLVRLYSN
jgi:hypothetical protein